MKIIFLCGSIEPGKDGVGDYTRRLAGELLKQGIVVRIIALKDPFINGVQEEQQNQAGNRIPVLRIGRNEKRRNINPNVLHWINFFDPDWLSLQFVPFAFQSKGLPWLLGNQLKTFGEGRKWHIMFHELWVGMDKKDSFKLVLLGRLQKILIKKTNEKLKPRVINTQTRLYQAQLNKLMYKGELLPLFGNIPKKTISKEKNNGFINVAIFGGIHKGAKLEGWLKNLPHISKYKFHFVGNNGAEQENWIQTLVKNYCEYEIHGWLMNEDISNILSRCQWGLTSTPYYLSGKSGSTAAMLEHNLTVFCIGRKWKPRNIKVEDLNNEDVIKWNKNLDMKYFLNYKSYDSNNNIEVIVKKFINKLETSRA